MTHLEQLWQNAHGELPEFIRQCRQTNVSPADMAAWLKIHVGDDALREVQDISDHGLTCPHCGSRLDSPGANQ